MYMRMNIKVIEVSYRITMFALRWKSVNEKRQMGLEI